MTAPTHSQTLMVIVTMESFEDNSMGILHRNPVTRPKHATKPDDSMAKWGICDAINLPPQTLFKVGLDFC